MQTRTHFLRKDLVPQFLGFAHFIQMPSPGHLDPGRTSRDLGGPILKIAR
jgi:hypothetical protein